MKPISTYDEAIDTLKKLTEEYFKKWYKPCTVTLTKSDDGDSFTREVKLLSEEQDSIQKIREDTELYIKEDAIEFSKEHGFKGDAVEIAADYFIASLTHQAKCVEKLEEKIESIHSVYYSGVAAQIEKMTKEE